MCSCLYGCASVWPSVWVRVSLSKVSKVSKVSNLSRVSRVSKVRVRVSLCVNRAGRAYGCASVMLCGCGMVLIVAAFLRFPLRVSGAGHDDLWVEGQRGGGFGW